MKSVTLGFGNKLGETGELSEKGEFYEFRNFMNTWSCQEQQLHESSANRLYECKPVKIIINLLKGLRSSVIYWAVQCPRPV